MSAWRNSHWRALVAGTRQAGVPHVVVEVEVVVVDPHEAGAERHAREPLPVPRHEV